MPNPIHPYSVYTTEQSAELLNVSVATVQRYIRNDRLKATKIGKWYRLSGQSLIDFMNLSREAVSSSAGRVRTVEEANFGRSSSFLISSNVGKSYLELFDLTSQTLIAILQPFDNDSEEELVMKFIGSRVFNHTMIAYRCALSGYYQGSYAVQRDLLEVSFLADLFRTFPERIKEWKTASNEERLKKFSPSSLYKELDKRDNFKEQKRKALYQQYCEYASHVSFPGFKLLANEHNLIEIGPFYDEKKLLNALYDLCRNFGIVVMNLATNIKSKNANSVVLAVKQMEKFDEVFQFKLTGTEKFIKTKANIEELLKELVRQQNQNIKINRK